MMQDKELPGVVFDIYNYFLFLKYKILEQVKHFGMIWPEIGREGYERKKKR